MQEVFRISAPVIIFTNASCKVPWPSCTSTREVPAAAATRDTHSLLRRKDRQRASQQHFNAQGLKEGGGALASHVIKVCLVDEGRQLQQVTAGRGSRRCSRLAGSSLSREWLKT